MANISISVGAVTGTVAGVSDLKAQVALGYYLAAKGGPIEGTNQEKLTWIAEDLRNYVVQVALDRQRQEALQSAYAEVDALPTEF